MTIPTICQKVLVSLAFLIPVLWLTTSCSAPVPTQAGLEARVQQYAEHRYKQSDWRSVYSYLLPEIRRQTSLETFVNQRSSQFLIVEYRVESVKAEGAKGESHVWFKYRIKLPKDQLPYREGESRLTESWEFQNGEWYVRWE